MLKLNVARSLLALTAVSIIAIACGKKKSDEDSKLPTATPVSGAPSSNSKSPSSPKENKPAAPSGVTETTPSTTTAPEVKAKVSDAVLGNWLVDDGSDKHHIATLTVTIAKDRLSFARHCVIWDNMIDDIAATTTNFTMAKYSSFPTSFGTLELNEEIRMNSTNLGCSVTFSAGNYFFELLNDGSLKIDWNSKFSILNRPQ